jgi:hypothetical protein
VRSQRTPIVASHGWIQRRPDKTYCMLTTATRAYACTPTREGSSPERSLDSSLQRVNALIPPVTYSLPLRTKRAAPVSSSNTLMAVVFALTL